MSPASHSTTIDARGIAPLERRGAVLAAFRAIGLDAGLELVSDLDPRPLYEAFKTEVPGNFSWVQAKAGPGLWRVNIKKLARDHAAGECCGVCCHGTWMHTSPSTGPHAG